VRKLVHPVLFTAFATVASLKGFAAVAGFSDPQGPLTRYLTHSMSPPAVGGGDLLLFCLGPAVITFGLEMYARRRVMAAQWFEVCGSAVAMAGVGLFGTAALARGLGLAENLRLATTMRQITSPLALSCANTLATDGSIAVALVVVTGLLGANFGGSLMTALGIKSPVARGLTMGATAHGLGTASMASDEPKAFAFSAIAMALVGTVTAALVAMPPVRVALRATAGVP
jgi:putative effector of murein hydrolase